MPDTDHLGPADHNDPFEADLTALLDRRADQVTVHPDPEVAGLGQRLTDRTPASSGIARWWLAVAACAGAIGLTLSLVPGGGAGSTAPGLTVPAAAAATRLAPGEIIVWLEIGVGPEVVADLRADLERLTVVERVVHFDEDATWDEFTTYFADKPEVIKLVEPDQLPMSLRVTTTAGDTGPVVDLATGHDGVAEVEVGQVIRSGE